MNGVSKIFFVLAVLLYGQLVEAYVRKYVFIIHNNAGVPIKVDYTVNAVDYTVNAGVPIKGGYTVLKNTSTSGFSLGTMQPGEKRLKNLDVGLCLSTLSISSVDDSYWSKSGNESICENKIYNIITQKDKDGNPKTETIGKKAKRLTKKLFDIISTNK